LLALLLRVEGQHAVVHFPPPTTLYARL
jgi:hypothetical protein